jgi:hypothetical protein
MAVSVWGDAIPSKLALSTRTVSNVATMTKSPLVVLLLVCLMARPVAAEEGAEWPRLFSLPVGAEVRLTLSNGSDIEGRLVEIRGAAVELREVKARYVPSGTSVGEQATFHQSDVVLLQIAPRPTQSTGGGFPWKLVIIAGAIAGVVILVGAISALTNQ